MIVILVTGASGRVGTELVRELARMDRPFRALVRTTSAAELVTALGGEAVLGDFDALTSIEGAMAGVQTAFLLCPLDESAERRTAGFVEQAKLAGVQRIVRLSAMGVGSGPDIPIARAQRNGEELIEKSGLSWTHLRPNTFMTNFLFSAQSVVEEAALYAPAGSGAISFIDPRDIASVAARVLTEDFHDGEIYELTGPRALTHDDVAAVIAAAVGLPVKYVDISAEIARRAMTGAGMSEWYVDKLIGFYEALRASAYWARVTPSVEALTGSPARSFESWVSRHATAFGRRASN